jgi:PAS domain S-box-containing protein
MALMALDGRLFRVNRAMVQILGRSTEELLRTTVRDLTHPDDHEASAEALGRLLSGQAPSWQLELRYIHHDGHPVWVSLSWSLVRDVQGTALYFVCQMEDITERKASGEALAHQAIHDPLTGARTAHCSWTASVESSRAVAAPADGRPCSSTSTASGRERQPGHSAETGCPSRSPTASAAPCVPTSRRASVGTIHGAVPE